MSRTSWPYVHFKGSCHPESIWQAWDAHPNTDNGNYVIRCVAGPKQDLAIGTRATWGANLTLVPNNPLRLLALMARTEEEWGAPNPEDVRQEKPDMSGQRVGQSPIASRSGPKS